MQKSRSSQTDDIVYGVNVLASLAGDLHIAEVVDVLPMLVTMDVAKSIFSGGERNDYPRRTEGTPGSVAG